MIYGLQGYINHMNQIHANINSHVVHFFTCESLFDQITNHVSACICKNIDAYAYMFMHMQACGCISMHINVSACICMNIDAYAYMLAHMHTACIPMHTNAYRCIPMHLHAYQCIPMHTDAYPRGLPKCS